MKVKKLLQINEEVRNIYNQKEISSFIQNLIEQKNLDTVSNSYIVFWLKHNFRNFLYREQKSEIILSPVLNEEWMRKSSHNVFSLVLLNNDLYNKTSHIVDYFISEKNNVDLKKISYNDALVQSISWTENQKKVNDDFNGHKTALVLEDNFSWIQLINNQAIDYEGYQMSHCVAKTYKNDILNHKRTVYSLRDSNNIPHATVMLNNETKIIEEIKGKSNHALKPIYERYTVDLLNSLKFFKIDNSQKDYIPNITFNSHSGDFLVARDNSTGNNFYSHHCIKLHNCSILKSNYNRPVSFNKIPVSNLVPKTTFFDVSLIAFEEQDFNFIQKFNSEIIKIENVSTINKLSFINNCKILTFIQKQKILIDFSLETPNLKELFFIPFKKISKDILNKKFNVFNFNNLDFSKHSEMDTLYFESATIKNLKLSNLVKKLVFKNCTIVNIDFENSSCETLIIENSDFKNKNNHIKGKNIILKNSIIKNDIFCCNLVTDINPKILSLKYIGNVFFENEHVINKPEDLNLSKNYFSSKSIINPITYFENIDYPIPHIDFSLILNEKFQDLFQLEKMIDVFKFSTINFQDIHIIKQVNHSVNFSVSNSFLTCNINDILQILLFETIKVVCPELDTFIFEQILKLPITENTLNHIFLSKENKNFCHLNSVIDSKKESFEINDIEILIYNNLKCFEVFSPFLDLKYEQHILKIPIMDENWDSYDFTTILDKINIQKENDLFILQNVYFEKLYNLLKIPKENSEVFLEVMQKVLTYDFIPDSFRTFSIDKFTEVHKLKNFIKK